MATTTIIPIMAYYTFSFNFLFCFIVQNKLLLDLTLIIIINETLSSLKAA